MHNRLRRIILAASLFVSACATTAAPAPTESSRATPATSDSLTATPVALEPTLAPTTTAPATPTVAPTDTPAPTATPQPEPHWHWAIQPDTGQIVAVNQFGEANPIGAPRPDLVSTALAFPLGPGRAILLADDGVSLNAYLLTSQGLDPIQLPGDLPYNAVTGAAFLKVVGVHDNAVAFWYETFGGEAGHTGTVNPPHGPLIVVNLNTLTGALVDPDVNIWFFDDPRAWAHRSTDGRYLRYLVGDKLASRIRELDLTTGFARTVHALTGKVDPFVRASLDGSAWLLENDGVLLDLTTGALTPQNTGALWLEPLGPDLLLFAGNDCSEPCAMQLMTAAGQVLDGTYQPPWGQIGALTLLLPGRLKDGALIAATSMLDAVVGDPAIAARYPELDPMDRIVFRLEPDGASEVLGLLPTTAVSPASPLPLSADGRFVVLLAPDRTTLRLLDLIERRTLADVSLPPELVDLSYSAQFFEHGVYVSLDAETVEGAQQGLRFTYLYATGSVARLDEAEPAYTLCNDLLTDGSILCWHYPDWNGISSQFVRYSPDWSEATLLLEDHVLLEAIP